jgi:hypothetical protein
VYNNMDTKERGCDSVCLIHLGEDGAQCRTVVRTAIKEEFSLCA